VITNGTPAPQASGTLLGFLNALLRGRNLILGTTFGLVAIVVAITLLRPKDYVAESGFVPQTSESNRNALSGLAAQFGVSVPSGSQSERLDLYARVLESRELLQRAAAAEYTVAEAVNDKAKRKGNLIEVLGIEAKTEPLRRRKIVKWLERNVVPGIDKESGVVGLKTYAPDPRLAEQINRNLLSLLDEFNLQTRQTQAAAKRKFAEERTKQAQQELRAAEAALESFYQNNRRFNQASQAAFTAARLERGVELRQQVYIALAQAYEQARIDEIRDTPVLSVIEPPEGTAEDPSSIVRNVVLAGLVGVLLGITLALGREALRYHKSSSPEEYREFEALTRATLRRRKSVEEIAN
jgi:uncharacterized protein involved in exopolysaccharide biosynthesis